MNIVYIPVDLDNIEVKSNAGIAAEEHAEELLKEQELIRKAKLVGQRHYQNVMAAEDAFRKEKQRIKEEYLTALSIAEQKYRGHLEAFSKKANEELDAIEREARAEAIPI